MASDPTYEAWVEYRKKLPNGGTFTRLKPGPIPEPESHLGRNGGTKLIRFGGQTIRVTNKDSLRNIFPQQHPTKPSRRKP